MSGIRIKQQGNQTRYIGIEAEAKRLGVSYGHLWQVLQGRRSSKRILSEVRIQKMEES